MDEAVARSHCLENGSQLLSYKNARAANLVLPSGEQLVIIIGTATAKVSVGRGIFRFFPTCNRITGIVEMG